MNFMVNLFLPELIRKILFPGFNNTSSIE